MSEPDVTELLTVEQAIAVIDAEPVTPRTVQVALQEAVGQRLAEAIVADRDYPPFDKSLMDGYAVRATDLREPITELENLGEIAAGDWPTRAVEAGQAIAIMTGAPMPSGADGVVPVEWLAEPVALGAGRIALRHIDRPSRYVAQKGADAKAGDVLLPAGTALAAAQLAVAASVGAAVVRVHARPRVAVLGSGDEIVPIDAVPRPGQIRNSNNPMLASLLTRLGCDVTDLGVVRDDPQAVRAALQGGREYDVLFVTGGMSMGQHDYVPRTLIELGATMHVSKLRIKPGKPFVFAKLGGTHVFGLPGNPVSAFVCTLRLAARLLARLRGGPAEPAWRFGVTTDALPANGPREFYQPGTYDGHTVRPMKWRGSADVYTLAAANVLIIHPEHAPATAVGGTVRLLEIPS